MKQLLVLIAVLSACELLAAQPAQQRTWVYFRDKGGADVHRFTPSELGITERALKRRAKVLPANNLIDDRDLPVAASYLDQLAGLGIHIHSTSRWLNAASVEATPSQLLMLQARPFVATTTPVMTQRRKFPETISAAPMQPFQKKTGTILDYGLSVTQLTRNKAVDVQALGINGTGVVVGMIDDGFNNHTVHPALNHIPVLAEWDFVQQDGNTSRAPGEYFSQGDHGASTLSCVAAFDNGNMIGAAYGVSVVLAKTEIDSVEIHLEEDNYVAALEWMERLGVDIASSSLGYDDFDPSGLYNAGDVVYVMKNGRTAKTSIAASVAARKGVLLVTAMGNERWAKTDSIVQRDANGNILQIIWGTKPGATGSIVTPADADSVVSVGATNSAGTLTTFSSTGPTADGRTKPEVINQGLDDVLADGGAGSGYYYGSGTSFATPLTAGCAALVLSAHPELTPMQVREALMNTALQDVHDSRIGSLSYPNNYYGWGYVNAYDATLYWGLVFSNRPTVTVRDTSVVITTMVKSKSALIPDSLLMFFKKTAEAGFHSVKLTSTGLPNEFAATLSKSQVDSTTLVYFSAADNSPKSRKNPFNAPDSIFILKSLPTTVVAAHDQPAALIPHEFRLRSYPNPFNPSTTIEVDVARSGELELAVFNLLGQRVRVLQHGWESAGTMRVRWDGTNDQGHVVAGGIYVARLKTPNTVVSTKLIFLK